MTLTSLLSFSLFAFMAALTPGPNNLMLAASGANFGFYRSLPHIFGICIGFGLLVIAAGLGLGSFLHIFPQIFFFLKYIALLFLFYLVWKIATAASPKFSQNAKLMSLQTAALFQWVNPKGITVVISAITAYLDAASNIWQALPSMLFIFILMTAIGTSLWTWLGSIISVHLSNTKQRIIFNYCMATALLISMLPAILSIGDST
jgi:threonine/homoserine/homoserine lactone efflux protein